MKIKAMANGILIAVQDDKSMTRPQGVE